MACAIPPELDERSLLAYLDGEADRSVVSHLDACAHCRESARRLARLQARLTSRLYRVACPSTLELGEYHLGLLARAQAANMAQHLTECPHCRQEVAELKDFLSSLAPELEGSIVERVKVFIAELISQAGETGRPAGAALAPAYAGIRGEAAAPRRYSAGHITIAVSDQGDAQPPQRRLLGLISGAPTVDWEVHLWQAGRRAATAPVDELGNFVVDDLAPGVYDLIANGGDTEVHIRELDVGAG